MKRLKEFFYAKKVSSIEIDPNFLLKRFLYPSEQKEIAYLQNNEYWYDQLKIPADEESVIKLKGPHIFKSFWSETIYLFLFYTKYLFGLIKGLGLKGYFIELRKGWNECKKSKLKKSPHYKGI